MPTVCELKIKAKEKGLVGYSKMKKDALMKLVMKAKNLKIEEEPKGVKGLTEKQKKNLPINLQKAILAKRKKM